MGWYFKAGKSCCTCAGELEMKNRNTKGIWEVLEVFLWGFAGFFAGFFGAPVLVQTLTPHAEPLQLHREMRRHV